MKLTKADIETLKACDDWKAPWQVVTLRGLKSTPTNHRNVRNRLIELWNSGALEFGIPNQTYRISDAGRAALERSEG